MKTTPSLTDIYTNVLISEGKKNLDVKKSVSKPNVVTKNQKIGETDLVGDGPDKIKLPQKTTSLKTKKVKSMESYNSFEKLFKSTLNEDEKTEDMESTEPSTSSMDFEVPTSGEDMADELEDTEDEVSDLVSDLKDVVSKLNDILANIDSDEENIDDETEDGSPEEEFQYEEGEDEVGEDESELNKESVEVHGAPLVNVKSGKDFEKKKNYVVRSKLKVKKGSAHTGKYTEEPVPKKATMSHKDLCNTKNSKVKTSNIKPGEFFK